MRSVHRIYRKSTGGTSKPRRAAADSRSISRRPPIRPDAKTSFGDILPIEIKASSQGAMTYRMRNCAQSAHTSLNIQRTPKQNCPAGQHCRWAAFAICEVNLSRNKEHIVRSKRELSRNVFETFCDKKLRQTFRKTYCKTRQWCSHFFKTSIHVDVTSQSSRDIMAILANAMFRCRSCYQHD